MYLVAKLRLRLWLWRVLVGLPLILLFLAVALIPPLSFLGFFDEKWMAANPINSWVLGALIYLTTCYILTTSPEINRVAEWLLAADLRLRQAIRGPKS